MKLSVLTAIASILLGSPALAEPPPSSPPPAFAPIDEGTYREWVERIKKAPWEQANPVLMVLDRMEVDAQAKAASAAAAKAKEMAPKSSSKP